MLPEKEYKKKGNTIVVKSLANKNPPLTSKMIVDLLAVITADGRTGSLTELIKRGFIEQKKITANNHKAFQWEITDKGIAILNNLGIEYKGTPGYP